MYAYVLVGLPGTGKTTFRNHLKKMHANKAWAVISLDDYIEWVAQKERSTYTEVFTTNKEAREEGERRCWRDFKMAVQMKRPVIIDRTNLDKESRAKWLKEIPKSYRITAVVMKEPEPEDLKERLNRPGKEIPDGVLLNMRKRFEYPDMAEGFSNIYEWPQEIQLHEELEA